MLKITITNTDEEQRWKLQGRLAGMFVPELLSNWTNTRETRRGRRCTMDLDDVTFIDEEGERALGEIMKEGAQPVAKGVYTRQLLAELRSRNRQRTCRFLGRIFAIVLPAAGIRITAAALFYLALGSTGTARAQTGVSQSEVSPGVSVSAVLSTPSPYLGSVPSGNATNGVLQLSLRDAFDRGFRFNLGLIQSDLSAQSSRSERLKSLSDLLPNVGVALSQSVEQINLKAIGFNVPIPGVPTVVGPFGVQQATANLSQRLFDWNATQKLKAATERMNASRFSYRNSRELVVLVVGNAYLRVISDAANVESQFAQLKTSEALHRRAVDRRDAGLAARIDELRARVEMQTQQQRLIAAKNQLEKDKLSLARVIGLPPGQQFTLTDTAPYSPLEGITVQKALEDAYANRPDYASAKTLLRAAEHSRKAAVAENYPSLGANLSYGDVGPTFGNSHGVVVFAGTLTIPVFQGGRVKADVLEADATLRQRRAEAEDLRARIDSEVRASFLDLESAGDLVSVAKSNMTLAGETLAQARDRFDAGVTDNIEVVQAQESIASAEQAYITSLYTFNIAKVELARAAGVAEKSVLAYLGGK